MFARHPWLPRGMLGALWGQALRALLMMRLHWPEAPITPAAVAVVVLVAIACGVGLERLFIPGEARFHWPSLMNGWFPVAVAAWACWCAAGRRGGSTPAAQAPAQPSAASLFAMLHALALPASLIAALVLVPIYRSEDLLQNPVAHWFGWRFWVGLFVWLNLAQALLIWRGGRAGIVGRLAAIAVLASASVAHLWMGPSSHWHPVQYDAVAGSQEQEEEPADVPQLSQEDMERQPLLLQEKLRALRPAARAEPGALYAVTFAPFADEDVFRRESELVASVMQERFGARGRTIQLVNHRDTLARWPWATPLNLQRTIRHIAKVMKRDEDILFIHLTSHGASNGELAAAFEPLAVDPVTPAQLRRWLDEAGVQWRVISISACFSGSWVPALADDRTLVMTAADADHTSYGCGRKSELTFFGRAMYDEQLRQRRDFEQAHAAARQVIARREQEAGKDDGYSNPQISMGKAIRPRLARLAGTLSSR